jgi:HAD superfamily hydrolase (TIGR01509 family)
MADGLQKDRPRAFLFDLDGTLIYSDPLHRAVFAEVLAPWGVDLTEALYTTHIHGRLNARIFADLAPGGDPVALGERKEAEFRRRLGASAPPIAGLPAFLDATEAAGIALAVVTNAPRANAEAMLSAIGQRHRFPVVIAEGEASAGKPDPAPYRLAAERLGVAPGDCIVFEDSPAGLRAGISAGARVVGLTTSLTAPELSDLGAWLAVADYTDERLAALLRRPTGVAP